MKSSRISRRPLFLFCGSFFLASVISIPSDILTKSILTLTVFLCASLTFILRRRIRASRYILTSSLAVLFALTISLAMSMQINDISDLDGNTVSAIVTIEEVKGASSNYGTYYAEITCEELPSEYRVRLSFPDGSAIPGDRFEGEIELHAPQEDEKDLLYRDRIFLVATAESLTWTSHSELRGIKYFMSKLNDRLSSRLDPVGDTSVSPALLLGNRDSLTAEVKRDFSRLGISHLLALSGLHLSIIVGVFDTCLSKLSVKRKLKCVLEGAGIIFFMALTGLSSSILRAGIMHLIKLTADMFDRENDSLTTLSVSAFVILVCDPFSLYDAGYVLSVLASYACIAYSHASGTSASTRKGFISRILNGCVGTAKLTVFILAITLPVMWYYFGEISLISPVSNIIFIPLMTLLLYIAMAAALFSGMPVLGTALYSLMLLTESGITLLTSLVSRLPGITLRVSSNVIEVMSALLCLTLILCPLVSKKLSRKLKITSAGLAALILCTVTLLGIFTSKTCELDYLTSGKNNGMVIRNGKAHVLIDISDGSKGFAYKLLTAAKDSGACEIDTLVLTHLHIKHVTSTAELCDSILTRRILIPSPRNDGEKDIADKLIKLCSSKNISVIKYDRDNSESYSNDGLRLSFYEGASERETSHSVVVFNVKLGNISYSYCGGSWYKSVGQATIIKDADTVFFGTHPPKGNKTPKCSVNNAVFADTGADHNLLSSVEVIGKEIFIPDDSLYCTGPYKK